MRGAIEYLRTINKICIENKKDCKKCKLGKQDKMIDTICPRLTDPQTWDTHKIAKMVNKTKE